MLHKKSKSIIQNIFSLAIGQTVSTVLSFLAITLAARYLGVENFGRFNFLLAIVVVVSRAIDLGLVPIVFRELSKNKLNYDLLNSALIIRIVAFLPTWIIFNIFVYHIQFPWIEILLANMLLTNTFFSAKFVSFRELLDIPFKVNLKMHFPMAVTVLDNLLLLIFVLLMPLFNGGLNYFVVTYLVANFPGFVIIIILLKRKFDFRLNFKVHHFKWLIISALPIYGYVLLDVLYQQLDVLLLKYYFDYYEIGIYSASIRLVVPLLFFSTAIIHTFFPIINENIISNIEQNKKIISFVFKMLFLFPMILFLLFFFKSKELIVIIFGHKYGEAATSTLILLFAQVFVYFNFFVLNLTVAYNKQKWNFYFSGYLLISNLLFNIMLIPLLNYKGAALAKLLTALTASIFAGIFLNKLGHKINFLNFGMIYWLILIGMILFSLSLLNAYIYSLIAVPIIVVTFLYSGALTRSEIDYLAQVFKIEKLLIKFRIIRW